MSEAVENKSDPPTSKGKLLIERLNAYRNLILAVAALATAVGSWFRPTDTTATKNSFEWTSKKIEELAANDLKTKEDIVAIRNYLEGYVQAQKGFSGGVGTVTVPIANDPEGIGLGSIGTIGRGSGSGFGSGAGASRPSRPRPRPPQADQAPEPAFSVIDAVEPPPLPELQANPLAIKSPEFEQIADKP